MIQRRVILSLPCSSLLVLTPDVSSTWRCVSGHVRHVAGPSGCDRAWDQQEILQSAIKRKFYHHLCFDCIQLSSVSCHCHVPAVNNNRCGHHCGGFVRISDPMVTLQHPVICATWHLATSPLTYCPWSRCFCAPLSSRGPGRPCASPRGGPPP